MIKVLAKADGIYNKIYRFAGDKFEIEIEEQFSEIWMIRRSKDLKSVGTGNGRTLKPVEAIREFCFRCQGWSGDGPSPKKNVRECQASECNLYSFRMGKNPFDKRAIGEDELKRRSEQCRGVGFSR